MNQQTATKINVMVWRNVEPKSKQLLHSREYKRVISKRVYQPKRKVRSVKTMKVRSVKTMKKNVNEIQRTFREEYKKPRMST